MQNTNASTTTDGASGGTSSRDIEPKKLPAHLIKLDSRNKDGEQIFMAVLLLAKNSGGWSNAFGHKKKIPFMEEAAATLFDINGQLNHFKRPTVVHITRKFNEACKLVDNLLVTAHSVRDGTEIEEEQYPDHLKDIIQLYSKLKEGAESRKEQSKKTTKVWVREIMSESNDPKKRMTDAICKMPDQQVGKVIDEARINLEKEKSDYNNSCQNNKESRKRAQDFRKNEHFEKKLTFRAKVFEDSKKQRRLAFLKEARDSIVVQYSNATENEIKAIFKEELTVAIAMYMKALKDY